MTTPDLMTRIREIEATSGGTIALAARDLQSGRTTLYNKDLPVKTASVIKLPILVHITLAVSEGALDWETPLTLTEQDKVDGSGILTQLSAGLTMSLRDICRLMIVLSDNTATNMALDHAGKDAVNARMRGLGLPVTTVFRKAYHPDEGESRRYGLGVTTAAEMLHLLTLTAEDRLGHEDASAEIRKVLEGQYYRDAIPRFLPPDWTYAGKTGAIDAARNDVGIVTTPDGRRWALALFCQDLPIVQWTPDNPGLMALARLARVLTAGG